MSSPWVKNGTGFSETPIIHSVIRRLKHQRKFKIIDRKCKKLELANCTIMKNILSVQGEGGHPGNLCNLVSQFDTHKKDSQ